MGFKDIQLGFLSVFREFFVYHHRSLEFRAKLFAAMISIRRDIKDSDDIYEVVREIGSEIYSKDEERIEILVRTTKEYVDKIITDNGLNLDQLIFDLDRILKNQKRFAKKINIEHLTRFKDDIHEDIGIVQQRVIEFAQNQKDVYLKSE